MSATLWGIYEEMRSRAMEERTENGGNGGVQVALDYFADGLEAELLRLAKSIFSIAEDLGRCRESVKMLAIVDSTGVPKESIGWQAGAAWRRG